MDRHFSCTACGKCCSGWLPLSIDDALLRANIFPLFLLWTPLRQGGKSYDLTAKIGFTLKLKNRKHVAVRLTPMSYVPPQMNCQALAGDNLCSIHEQKPSRCRAMPFSASRDETDQLDLLMLKPGWECDISDSAPLVYKNKKILQPDEFLSERKKLISDSAILKPFAQLMLDSKPNLRVELEKMAARPHGGNVIINFLPLIHRLANVDINQFAVNQLMVMESMIAATAQNPQYDAEHKHYVSAATELRDIVKTA